MGVTIYAGFGWAVHLSTEDGLQVERADHRALRLGFVVAVRSRRLKQLRDMYDVLSHQRRRRQFPGLAWAYLSAHVRAR